MGRAPKSSPNVTLASGDPSTAQDHDCHNGQVRLRPCHRSGFTLKKETRSAPAGGSGQPLENARPRIIQTLFRSPGSRDEHALSCAHSVGRVVRFARCRGHSPEAARSRLPCRSRAGGARSSLSGFSRCSHSVGVPLDTVDGSRHDERLRHSSECESTLDVKTAIVRLEQHF